MARFDGKTVLITGGTSGIGLAAAQRIAAEGGTVGLTGMNPDHIAAAEKSIPGAKVLRNDAGDVEAAQELADWAKAELGVLHGVFLNAGAGGFREIDAPDALEHWDRLMDINARGPFLHAARLSPLIADNGSIVITGSVAPYRGMSGAAAYGATKAAVRAMVRHMATHFAPRGIRVNALTPGATRTNFGVGAMPEDQREAFEARVAQIALLKRLGTAEEVAAVGCFLLSDDASFVTGSEYIADGGATLA